MDSHLNNIIRIGLVSSVDEATGTARVKFTDKNNLVSGPLIIIKNKPSATYKDAEGETNNATVSAWFPKVGEMVLCLFLPNGHGDGFIVGGI